jgi:hypothetical protein
MSSIYPVSTPDLADGEIPIGASAVSASRPPIKRIAHLRRLLRRGISIRPMSGWGHERPKGDVCVESVRLPTADIGRHGL